jgi:hypothetical protein
VDPRAGLDRYGKISPPPGFDHRTVQPIASRYSDPPLAPEPFRSPVGNLDPINFNIFGSFKDRGAKISQKCRSHLKILGTTIV